jgi:hypothetical protein
MNIIKTSTGKLNWYIIIGISIFIIIIFIILIRYFKTDNSKITTKTPGGDKGENLPNISLNELKEKVKEFQKGNAAAVQTDLECYVNILYDNLKLNVSPDDIYGILKSNGLKASDYKSGLLSSISILSKELNKNNCDVYIKLKNEENYENATKDTIFNAQGVKIVFENNKDPVGSDYTEYSFLTLLEFLSNLYKEGLEKVILSQSNNLKLLNKQLIDANAFKMGENTNDGNPIIPDKDNIPVTTPSVEVITTPSTTTTTPFIHSENTDFTRFAATKLENFMYNKIQTIFPFDLKNTGKNFDYIIKLLSGNTTIFVLQRGLAYIIQSVNNNKFMSYNETTEYIKNNDWEGIWDNLSRSPVFKDVTDNMSIMLYKSIINETILRFILKGELNEILNGIRKGLDFIFSINNYPTQVPNYPTNVPNYPTNVPKYYFKVEEYIKQIIEDIKNETADVVSQFADKIGNILPALDVKDIKSFFYDYAKNPVDTLKHLDKLGIGDNKDNITWFWLYSQILQIISRIVDSKLNEIKNDYSFTSDSINQAKNMINPYLIAPTPVPNYPTMTPNYPTLFPNYPTPLPGNPTNAPVINQNDYYMRTRKQDCIPTDNDSCYENCQNGYVEKGDMCIRFS